MKYRDIPWIEANCRNTDTPSWFPERGRLPFGYLSLLKRICDACPIEEQCLSWATEKGERGFWGGQYFPERMEMDDVDDGDEVHTPDDGDWMPEVWPDEEGEMYSPDW